MLSTLCYSKPFMFEVVRSSFALKRMPSVVIAALLLLRTSSAKADRRLEWAPEWRRVDAVEYVSIAVLAGGYAAMRFIVPPRQSASWTEPILVDDVARDLLRFEHADGQAGADLASDILLDTLLIYPWLVDVVLVTAVADSNLDVAWQLGVIDAQSFALSLFVTATTKRLIGRRRPYAASCGAPGADSRCRDEPDPHRSFYSSHAVLGATSAGLTCAHHTQLPLYGGGFADGSACIGAATLALATGLLRVSADGHWFSDVALGWTVGAGRSERFPDSYYRRSDTMASSARTPEAPERAKRRCYGRSSSWPANFRISAPSGCEQRPPPATRSSAAMLARSVIMWQCQTHDCARAARKRLVVAGFGADKNRGGASGQRGARRSRLTRGVGSSLAV
jgi:membrane-associated phospholipid phosphatase